MSRCCSLPMYSAVACIWCLPLGRDIKMHARFQSAGWQFRQHFQQCEWTGRLGRFGGNSMFVPRLTPTSAFRLDSVVDFNVGRCEYPLEAPVYVRCLFVVIKRSSTRRCSHCFVVAHKFDLPRQLLSIMPRASAAFAVDVNLRKRQDREGDCSRRIPFAQWMPRLTTPLRLRNRQ
jgi:hypothetical protein